jgi:putative acetyltransferase
MSTPSDAAGRVRSGAGSGGFVIREARPSDVRSYLECYREVMKEGRYIRTEDVRHRPRWWVKRFRSSWTDDEANLVAVAEADTGWVIGSLGVSREEHPVNRHVASLGMMVARGWRGRGIGSALMTEAIRWAEQMGVEKLALSVYPDNAPALALYAKFGFVEEGRMTGHSKKAIGYRDEIVMGRWLIPQPNTGGDA